MLKCKNKEKAKDPYDLKILELEQKQKEQELSELLKIRYLITSYIQKEVLCSVLPTGTASTHFSIDRELMK